MARTPGSVTRRYSVQNARQRAWNGMRIFKRFTLVDLELSAEINERNLRTYLHALHRTGFLRIERPKRNGRAMGHIVWRIAPGVGPQAPIVRRDQSGVYDPNTDRLIPYSAADPADPAPEAEPHARTCR